MIQVLVITASGEHRYNYNRATGEATWATWRINQGRIERYVAPFHYRKLA